MPIITTLDTLSEAWIILDELGLSAALIPGNKVATDAMQLATQLLSQRKLHAFVGCISGLSIDEAGKLTLPEAIEAITAFFTAMASELASLAGIWIALQNQPSQ